MDDVEGVHTRVKRSRGDSIGSSHAVPQETHPQCDQKRYSLFFNDPRADIVLVSSDGRFFATRRAFLIAASPIFDDMFSICNDSQLPGIQETNQGTQIIADEVRMEEGGEELEYFLRWIHRETYKDIRSSLKTHEGNTESISDMQILWILRLAHKYDVDSASLTACELVKTSLKRKPVTAIAIAIAGRNRDLAQEAISVWVEARERLRAAIVVSVVDALGLTEETEPTCRDRRFHIGRWRMRADWTAGRLESGISDISPALFAQLPAEAVHHLAVVERQMIQDKIFDPAEVVTKFLSFFDSIV